MLPAKRLRGSLLEKFQAPLHAMIFDFGEAVLQLPE
jgi:hypothetical protein